MKVTTNIILASWMLSSAFIAVSLLSRDHSHASLSREQCRHLRLNGLKRFFHALQYGAASAAVVCASVARICAVLTAAKA